MLSQEEINAKIGLDASKFIAASEQITAVNKKTATEYAADWKAAFDLEAAAGQKSLGELKYLNQQKLTAQKEFFAAQKALYEEQAAVSAIGQGSIPANMAGAARGAGTVAKDAAEAEKASGSFGKMRREFRELTRVLGELTGMSAVTGILRAIGITLTGFLSAVPIIGAAVAAGMGMKHEAGLMDAAAKTSDQSKENVTKSSEKLQKRLSEIVQRLAEGGRLSGTQGAELSKRVSAGGLDNLMFAQHMLQRMFPGESLGGGAADEKTEEAARQAGRVNMTPQQKWADTTKELQRTMIAMNALDKNSAEYKKEQLRYEELLKEQAEDSRAIAADTHKQEQDAADARKKAHKEEQDALQKEHDLKQEAINVQVNYNRSIQDQDEPTLADLAGRGYNKRLDAWKKQNLGRGNGPLGDVARDAERSQAMVQYSIEQGDAVFDKDGNLTGGGAFDWMQRQKRDIGQLRAAGLRDDKFDQMNEKLGSINQKLNSKINVNIGSVSDGN